MAFESVRSYVQLASGLGEMTKARALEAAQGLLSLPGADEVTRRAVQASTLADQLLAAAKANRASLIALIRAEAEAAVRHADVAHVADLDAARATLTSLTHEMAELRATLVASGISAVSGVASRTQASRGRAGSGAVSTTARQAPSQPSAPETAAKKATAKKATAKKATAKKATAKKATAKKATAKKATAKKATAKKATAKKATAKKATAKKATAKKATAKKATAKKTAAKKTAPIVAPAERARLDPAPDVSAPLDTAMLVSEDSESTPGREDRAATSTTTPTSTPTDVPTDTRPEATP